MTRLRDRVLDARLWSKTGLRPDSDRCRDGNGYRFRRRPALGRRRGIRRGSANGRSSGRPPRGRRYPSHNLQAVPAGLSPRLAAVVNALPLQPQFRVLEIGCGPGATARAVAARLVTGHLLAIDRSAKAIAQVRTAAFAEIVSGRMSVRQVAAEDFVLAPDDEPFDLVFAVRVGALDGRHPEAGEQALRRIGLATRPGARLFIDGGHPLRELTIPRSS